MNQGAAPEPIVVPDGGSTEANLNQLSHALRKYVAGSRSVPKDFNDFLVKSGVQLPPSARRHRSIVHSGPGPISPLADQ
jgi:hypothetical protein